MKWIIRIYSFILLAYTGYRTWDFMTSQMPKGDAAFWLGVIFLFATEAGLLLWDELYQEHSTTDTQENIARWMVWIDFVGATIAGLADMIRTQTMIDYAIPYWMAQGLIYGMPILMAVNVAAVFVFRQHDADAQIRKRKRQVQFEITRQALADLEKAKVEIARDKKALIYQHLRDEITGGVDRKYKPKVSGNLVANGETIVSAKADPVLPTNGKVHKNAEVDLDPTFQGKP